MIGDNISIHSEWWLFNVLLLNLFDWIIVFTNIIYFMFQESAWWQISASFRIGDIASPKMIFALPGYVILFYN